MVNAPEIAGITLFVLALGLIFSGLPVGFSLGSAAIVCGVLFWGVSSLRVTATSAYGMMSWRALTAVPLFLLMAELLRGSGVAEELFTAIRRFAGGVPGGLAMGVILFCTVIAAMSGIAATGTVIMGIIALPVMLKLGYNKTMAIGPVTVGGTLGLLIPPSVAFIMYGALASVSTGRLFAGGVIPGLILASLYMLYIGIRCYFRPELGPPLPPEDRVGWKEKITGLRGIVLPLFLIASILGTIFFGIATPTEASAIGAAGAIVCAAIHHKLTWRLIIDSMNSSFRVMTMIGWLLVGALCFRAVFIATGVPGVVSAFIASIDVPPLVIIFIMQFTYMILGCFMDEISQMFITFPVYLPIVAYLGYDSVWFGVLFLVNLQLGQLTPPFGLNLFYLKSVAPPEITLGDITHSILPFIPLIIITLLLVMFFPQLALWLPDLVFGLK